MLIFGSAIEGEIVVGPFVCDNPTCGCDRSHQGLNSHGFTTTVRVRDVELSRDELVLACRSHLDFSQWATMLDSEELDDLASALIDDMLDIADESAVDTVFRMRYSRGEQVWEYDEIAP